MDTENFRNAAADLQFVRGELGPLSVNDAVEVDELPSRPGHGVRGQGQAIGVDAAGNVVVAGTRKATWLSSGAEQAREFVVLKLSGDTATGSGWRRSSFRPPDGWCAREATATVVLAPVVCLGSEP